MTFREKKKTDPNLGFYDKVEAREFSSLLEVPDGRNPNQNAWLTITINYSLDFLDSNNLGGAIYKKQDKFYVKDFDKPPKEFLIRDWDAQSQIEFNRKFNKGAEFWNYKFLLMTPPDYNELNYFSWTPSWLCQPNVICLFRLSSGGSPVHLPIQAVRLLTEDEDFRSSEYFYDNQDVNTKTLWHELGHALDQLHIKALLGDQKCLLIDISARDCYVTPKGMEPNIMGDGKGLHAVNAKAWMELIPYHTDNYFWHVSQNVMIPPRKFDVGR